MEAKPRHADRLRDDPIPPFLFGLIVPVVALDGGRIMSFDSLGVLNGRRGTACRSQLWRCRLWSRRRLSTRWPQPLPRTIVPDAHVDSMPAMTTAFVAILSGLLAFVGWLPLHPDLEHSGELPAGIQLGET